MRRLPFILALVFFLSFVSFPAHVFARGGGGHSGGSHTGGSSRSGGGHTTGSGRSGSSHVNGNRSHPKTFCKTCPRDSRGRIERSSSERQKFLKSQGLTHTPPGYQVDHINPLSKGGPDKASNMQLIPKDSPKEKDELK